MVLQNMEVSLVPFRTNLEMREKSDLTVKKYVRDVKKFIKYAEERRLRTITKKEVLDYKEALVVRYKLATVNSLLISLDIYFSFLHEDSLRVKTLKIQRKSSLDSVLTPDEYKILLQTARKLGFTRLYYIIRTLASSGIRINELNYITTDMLAKGKTSIRSKTKFREIILPASLCSELRTYCNEQKIKGIIFCGKTPNKLLDKSYIWRQLKELSIQSGVPKEKVYPHNFRHFFAKQYLNKYNDIVELSDILGHTSIETTRIYTRSSGAEKQARINALNL
jgi:site-specific recombinase XerD